MNKIPRIKGNTRVSEVNGLLQQIIDEYQKNDYSNDAYVKSAFERAISLNEQLSIAIMRDSVESDLSELDDVTDRTFTLLHGLVKGYTCHPDGAIAGAAELLFKMLEKYGLEVKSKSYREEYPLLASLLGESKTGDYQACVVQLPGCEQRFMQLETAVDNFNAKQNAYYSVKDERKELDSASLIKKRLFALLNDDLVPYLFVMSKVNADVYTELTQFTANRIAENNTTVRNRSTKVEAEQ
ncbi:DUF6261 family protein [Carboxylicivirga sp. M1479]|uniref:DUF6261 family protein n=1 Tax=Carboxylicivirga sp. M1479 TaxID=2594476 RepID=UPI001177F93C|nr:DUF6261 family protein [Carboxylicivirga sp. M1479]TRX66447.1 hypothetical protein FNN09_13100 [Carboxylicivirga sp. M1479]